MSSAEQKDYKNLKCVVVGDGTVGKTTLILSYTTNDSPGDEPYQPTVYDEFNVSLSSSEFMINLNLCDTAGQEGYEDLRTLAYHNADIFLLCFSVDNDTSFAHAKSIWYREIKSFCPDSVIILVGTKSDLRKKGRAKVTQSQMQLISKKLGLPYIECSAKDNINVKEVFNLAMTEATNKMLNTANTQSSCSWDRIFCCKRER